MVWHIVKKDWRLLWPFVLALTALQGFLAFARFKGGIFDSGIPTTPAAFLELLAVAVVITLSVHQDPVPGDRQDWLVRPVSGRDLFLAKLSFAVLLVQGPWFATDLLQGLANGFSFSQSAEAAIACAAWVALALSLPVMAFAALMATTTETVVAAIGVFAIVIAFLIVPGLTGLERPAALTGFAWVPSLVREALLLAAAAGVLILQYGWRRMWTARALFAVALIAGLGAGFVPWRTTIRLDELLTGRAGDDGSITVAFAPDAGRFRLAPGQGLDDVLEKPGMGPVDVAAENQRRRAEGARSVFFPIRISGLVPGAKLLADRSEVTVLDRDGRRVYRGTGNDLELRTTGTDAIVHQGVRVPGTVYSRVKAEALDLQLDYWFTLFRTGATYALPARGGTQRMPGIGLCATKVDDAGTRVLLQCLQPGDHSPCLDVVLQNATTRRQNPDISLCVPDYTPYPGHTFPDAMSRFGGRLPFYDPSGLVRYPVGGPELPESRVLVTAFQPAAHLTRRVVIAAARLQEWEVLTPENAAVTSR